MKDTSHADKKYPYGPVRKLQLLHFFAKHQKISGKEWAVIVVIADMSNATNGTAWPSFKYLALEANTSERNIASVIKNLRAKGILKVPTPGNRYRSNTYQLNYDLLTELPISTEENNSTLLINSSISTDEIGSEVLIDGSVESIYQSEHEAMDKIDRVLDSDASPSRPLGASGLHLEKSLTVAFEDFWEIYPIKAGVYMAEKKLTELHRQTVLYSEILEGARRYAKYCLAISSRPRPADQWLEAQRWRDSWEVPLPKEKNIKQNGKYSREIPPGLIVNPAYKDWLKHPKGKSFDEVDASQDHFKTEFCAHLQVCQVCPKALFPKARENDIYNYADENLCKVGSDFSNRYFSLEDKYFELLNIIEASNGEMPEQYLQG